MGKPCRRAVAYMALWVLLGAIVLWRRAPSVEVERAPADLVSTSGALGAPATGAASPAPTPFRIDLNRDPWHRIALLEGIGEILARRIVATRERDGAFRSIDEVKRIPGIPDAPFDASADWITVDPPGSHGGR